MVAAGGSELLATQPNGCCQLLRHHDNKYGLRVLKAHAHALACVQATTIIYPESVRCLHCAVHANLLGCRSPWLPVAQQGGAARKCNSRDRHFAEV